VTRTAPLVPSAAEAPHPLRLVCLNELADLERRGLGVAEIESRLRAVWPAGLVDEVREQMGAYRRAA
jgi:hypothetical protein